MTYDEFKASLDDSEAPSGLSPEQQALWEDGKGNWERAHELVQDEGSTEAAWIHAYLHRREGDLSNAAYWYSRCGRPVCDDALAKEWERIVKALL